MPDLSNRRFICHAEIFILFIDNIFFYTNLLFKHKNELLAVFFDFRLLQELIIFLYIS